MHADFPGVETHKTYRRNASSTSGSNARLIWSNLYLFRPRPLLISELFASRGIRHQMYPPNWIRFDRVTYVIQVEGQGSQTYHT